MSSRLIIDGNAVYEIDEECVKKKKEQEKQKEKQKEKQTEGRTGERSGRFPRKE